MISKESFYPLFPLGAALFLWGVIFAALPPVAQNFPLNDDWAYGKGAFTFARGEGIHYYRQPSMPLLGQWLLAYPVIHVAGESHAALRLVTIALSLLGILAFYDLLRRESGFSAPEASFTASVLALNPLYFLLSGTFMSDIPALALSLASLASYTRSLRGGRYIWLAAGTVLATLATIERQNSIVTPIVFGVLLARDAALRRRPSWILGALVPVIAGVVVNSWFSGRADAVPLSPAFPNIAHLFTLGFAGILYLGLSVLPVLMHRPCVISRACFLISLFIMIDGAVSCLIFGDVLFPRHGFHGDMFPYLENMITPWGTLESGNYVVGERPLMMGQGMRAFLTATGCIGGAMFLDRLIGRLRRGSLASPLLLFFTLHVLILLISPTLYDRYLVVLMPGALAVAFVPSLHARRPTGILVLALFAACSLGLTHDWLAWNSARWELGRRALARGIPANAIEGGLEWDGWYAPGPVAPEGPQPLPQGLMLPFNRRRFPHITGRYALAFSKPQGAVVLDRQPYHLWLVPGTWQFLFVEQQGESDGR